MDELIPFIKHEVKSNLNALEHSDCYKTGPNAETLKEGILGENRAYLNILSRMQHLEMNAAISKLQKEIVAKYEFEK